MTTASPKGPLFTRRHHRWLARFAAEHIDAFATHELAKHLQEDNAGFKSLEFEARIAALREEATK